MTDKLLPCPFCGGEDFLEDYGNAAETIGESGRMYWHRVICKKCNGRLENCDGDLRYSGSPQAAKDKAHKKWNTRTERTCRNKAKSLRTFWCNECDCAIEDWLDVGGNLRSVSYCPNCGARVVEL